MNTLDAKEQYRQHPRSQEYFYWIELLPPAMLKDEERVLGKSIASSGTGMIIHGILCRG
ncbi:MAG TPA: hypothetical protein PLA65_19170 [Spirochaetota bacterium]|nr:hypothetical protein [Spirochaetota bacterium]HPN14188.1 hypothetical protein [Spirochaetota bacterium]